MSANTLAAAYAAALARTLQAATPSSASAPVATRTPEPSRPARADETSLMSLLRHSLSPFDQIMARKALSGASRPGGQECESAAVLGVVDEGNLTAGKPLQDAELGKYLG